MWHSDSSVVSSVSWPPWLWEGWRHTCLRIPAVSTVDRTLLLRRCCLIWGIAWPWTHCVAEGQLSVLFLLLAGVFPLNWPLASLCSAAPACRCSCWAERWGLSASSQNDAAPRDCGIKRAGGTWGTLLSSGFWLNILCAHLWRIIRNDKN